jgi:hypothetical protein
MIPWLESTTAQCRGMETFNETLADAHVLWEDSTIGPSGYVFCIGSLGKDYFFFEHTYDTHAEEPVQEIHMTPKDLKALKTLLKSLRDAKHAHVEDLLEVMKLHLTQN